MTLIRHFVLAAAAGLAVAASAGTASAWEKPCHGCKAKAPAAPPTSLFGALGKPKLPAFQAAPWYLYWPYDGHFLTPAPVSGPFYGPPLTGNFPVNPYFPGPAGAVGFGGGQGFGGGIPGGPAPGLGMTGPGGR